jgi:predicted nucleic acid-binding protein
LALILDTNAISDLFTGNQLLGNILEKLDKLHIPVIVLGEYMFGLKRSNYRKELEQLLETLEADSKVIPINRTTARHYAQIKHQLSSQGTPIPENDVWIASLARQHELEILSLDRHFDQVEGIVRISW